MHPVEDLYGRVSTPTGVLRAARLRRPEQVVGGRRYSLRIAFDDNEADVRGLVERLQSAHREAVARGREIFDGYRPVVRRRLGAVSSLPLVSWETEDGRGGGDDRPGAGARFSVLLRFERAAADGAPRISGPANTTLALRAEPAPGLRVRVVFRPEPVFISAVAAAGLRLALEEIRVEDSAAARRPLERAA